MNNRATGENLYRDPVWIGVALILVVHFAAALRPGVNLWGIDYWSDIPLRLRIVVVAAGLILIFPPVARRIAQSAARAPNGRLTLWAAVIALGGLMAVFHTRALVYGDGYSILAVIQNPELPKLIGNLKLQPFDLYLHWALYQYIVAPLGGTVALTYAIVGAACGVAGVAAMVRVARAVTTDRVQRFFLVMCGLTSGMAFLWFGHVESYTMAMTASLWVVALLLRSREHRPQVALAWAGWIVAMTAHALSVVLLPALLWGTSKRVRERLAGSQLRRPVVLIALGLGAGLIAAATGQLLHLKTFVPLLSASNNNYPVLSPAHLTDMVNLLFFVAPLSLLLLFTLGRRPGDGEHHNALGVLGLAALGLGLFAIWVDPMLGAFRDWDLLGAAGIPLSLLWGSVVIRRMGERWREWHVVPVVVLVMAHLGTWVAVNQSELTPALRVNRFVQEDSHYQAGYYQAGRRPVWGLILTNWLDRHDLAAEHFVCRLQCDPNDAVSWANLGIVYQHRRFMDSALACYGMAMKTDQDNPLYALAYGQVEHSMRNYQLARIALEKAVTLAPGLYEAQMALAMLYRDMGLLGESETRAHLALQLDASRPDANRLLDEIAKARSQGTKP